VEEIATEKLKINFVIFAEKNPYYRRRIRVNVASMNTHLYNFNNIFLFLNSLEYSLSSYIFITELLTQDGEVRLHGSKKTLENQSENKTNEVGEYNFN